jgi:hypothetical protein
MRLALMLGTEKMSMMSDVILEKKLELIETETGLGQLPFPGVE